MSGTFRSFLRFAKKPPVVGMTVLFVVFAGLWIDVPNAVGRNDNFYSDVILFNNVFTRIHQNYVEDMNSGDLMDNGISGMMRVLDPHTSYFKPDQYEELKIHTQGKFGGLGIQISIRDKVLTVMTPISGTPAYRAGIQSGDQIITIDGKSTAGITIDKAVGKLRGEPNTKVTITIRRKGEAKDMGYTITREIIHIKAVPYYGVIDSIGYIFLAQFSQEAGADVETAIRALLKKNIKGLVFDLRQNPGGLLPQAKEVAEKFLPKNTLVVSTRGRTLDQNHEFYSDNEPALLSSLPLVVLVNYGSASASEIVAGAIQDWDRGIIVGDTTFGKGSVQSVFPLDEKHHIKLTTAYYYTPSGRCINRPENGVRGVSADDEGESDQADSATADSIKNAAKKKDTATYRTKIGRTVYGGGGIIPDTVVHQEIPSMVIRTLFGKDVFFRFANQFYPRLNKKSLFVDGKIVISEPMMKDFYQFLDSINLGYESFQQAKFREFKKIAGLVADTTKDSSVFPMEKPHWVGQEKNDFDRTARMIDTLLSHESRRALADNESAIRRYLQEALLVRHLGQDDEV
nr:S41 family peptidase [Chitinispirillaceae bacterium]